MLMLLRLLVVLVVVFHGTVYAAPLRYGIFQKMHYPERVNNPTRNIENIYISGVEFIFNWAELEPEEGKFQWDLIDSVVAPWAQAGKRVILSLRTVQESGQNPTQPSATPPWVFESGADGFQLDGTNYPVYWDPVFLAKYERFVSAFASRYDGNKNIAFVMISLGTFGATKISSYGPIIREYENHGFTEELWSQTILNIIDIYRKYFLRKPLALTLSPFFEYQPDGSGDGSEIFLKPIAAYAAHNGIYLYNHSLRGTWKFANNPFLPWYEEFYGNTKIILGPDNPVIADPITYGTIDDVVANAFGGASFETPEGTKYVPLTHVSFLIFYTMDISAATRGSDSYDAAFDTAISGARRQLRINSMQTPVNQ